MDTKPGDVGFFKEAMQEAQVSLTNSEHTTTDAALIWAAQAQAYAMLAIADKLNDLVDHYYEVHR